MHNLLKIRKDIESKISRFGSLYKVGKFRDKNYRCHICQDKSADLFDMWRSWLRPDAGFLPGVNAFINVCLSCFLKETWDQL